MVVFIVCPEQGLNWQITVTLITVRKLFFEYVFSEYVILFLLKHFTCYIQSPIPYKSHMKIPD